jgi:predicted DNA-binding protein
VKQTRPDLVTFSVRLERETAARLREIADSEHRTVAAELRRLIEAHIEQHKAPGSKHSPSR